MRSLPHVHAEPAACCAQGRETWGVQHGPPNAVHCRAYRRERRCSWTTSQERLTNFVVVFLQYCVRLPYAVKGSVKDISLACSACSRHTAQSVAVKNILALASSRSLSHLPSASMVTSGRQRGIHARRVRQWRPLYAAARALREGRKLGTSSKIAEPAGGQVSLAWLTVDIAAEAESPTCV